ncbi:hypothetical protein HPP92_010938 [Vanilla planifolia]|uniref:Uncharacterized protein n=1 Tax=Vanilla planifolia TaxID=51239 RepID=A0A835QUS8_VANPL|nr:hypothetical protein HPP92_010938 [Vanilla planifolia]
MWPMENHSLADAFTSPTQRAEKIFEVEGKDKQMITTQMHKINGYRRDEQLQITGGVRKTGINGKPRDFPTEIVIAWTINAMTEGLSLLNHVTINVYKI